MKRFPKRLSTIILCPMHGPGYVILWESVLSVHRLLAVGAMQMWRSIKCMAEIHCHRGATLLIFIAQASRLKWIIIQ